MKEKIKNLLSKKPIRIICHIVNALVYAFTIFIIILLSVGSCSNRVTIEKSQIEEQRQHISRSIDYWEQGNGQLVLSSGYTTNYQELACSETWMKMEQTFGNVWSTFNDDYANWTQYITITCSGLYVQIPVYLTGNNSYELAYDDVSNNYSNNLVTSITIYNRVYYPWSSTPSECYGHAVDFTFGDYTAEMLFYKSTAGANQCSYSLVTRLFQRNVPGYTIVSNSDFSLFATKNFTYTDTFFVSDYWILSQSGEEKYRDGYQTGYDVGLEIGDNAGYTRGYNVGYDTGLIAGSTSEDIDMFTIIAHGFGAVADLMNINVFPGLTLGTLMFMPVIIITLIALFHLFKG